MMKMKLLTVVLITLVAIGVALAADVINVDIKGYGDDRPYVGNGAYDVGPNTVWTVYYGGWGEPVGSARSQGLRRDGQAAYPSIYASQVWLGDNGEIHGYESNSPPSLMNDGFTATAPDEPNLSIWGKGAYQGVYDIYVYGRDEGTFILTRYEDGTKTTTTKTVSGDANAGEFKLGQNYVVFENVDINNTISADLYLTYTNKLNGLQFVRKKDPCEVSNGTMIIADMYDVAGERNMDEPLDTGQLYGPDIFGSGAVSYIRPPEFMIYDINVNKDNEGQYQIGLDVNTKDQPCPRVAMYLDDKFLHDVNRPVTADPCAIGLTTTTSANLFAGKHTVQWLIPPGTGMYSNIVDVNFARIGDINMVNCADVVFYGFTLPTDYSHNCSVGLEDLGLAMDNWMNCNNPDANDCF